MAQVLAKEYECLTCHKPIKISKIDNAGPSARKNGRNLREMGRRHTNALVIITTVVVVALTITTQTRNIVSKAVWNNNKKKKKKAHPHNKL